MNICETILMTCNDDTRIAGDLWRSSGRPGRAFVIVNCATGVRASYYHRYARFLAENGFDVLTYDYRGIGASRPATLKGCTFRWRDWGALDFEAALNFAASRAAGGPLLVVGHSIGGVLPGFAGNAASITRMLTVGAQFAWWGDYAGSERVRMFMKWHVVMPVLTRMYGYFPAKRLGWHEDLPAGVANEWSFRRSRLERSFPFEERGRVLERFRSVTAPILAVRATDDGLASAEAVIRGLSYFSKAKRRLVEIDPRRQGLSEIGHMGFFHEKHRFRFWEDTLAWLKNGRDPWSTCSNSRTIGAEAVA